MAWTDVLGSVIDSAGDYFDKEAARDESRAAADLRRAAEIQANTQAQPAPQTVNLAGYNVPIFGLVAGGIGLITVIWILKG